MKSYIKIYGPPVSKAIRALEKLALDMPEVSIMSTLIQVFFGLTRSTRPIRIDLIMNYFDSLIPIPKQRLGKIISKSGESVGEYDFYFEWFKTPTLEEINNLTAKVDETLGPLGCKYTITTK